MTFKSNWEKAHTRVNLPKALILKMLGNYYAGNNDIKHISIIEGGCANVNVLVHLNDSDDPVILRIYLRDSEGAYREQKISLLLRDKVPVPKFYHVDEDFGYSFAIMECLSGKTLRDFLIREKKPDIPTQTPDGTSANKDNIMFKVGETLGVISSIQFPSSGFFNKNLEAAENLGSRDFVSFCSDCLEDAKVKAVIIRKKIEQIKTVFNAYKNLLPDGTEKNLVHGDFDPANILVTENNGQIEISGILDWEFSFSGSTLCDVANMLRYAHHMPDDYQGSFLKGLTSAGYQLPSSWKVIISLLNIASLLDCLRRSDSDNRPNQMNDIRNLIDHILSSLSKVDVAPR